MKSKTLKLSKSLSVCINNKKLFSCKTCFTPTRMFIRASGTAKELFPQTKDPFHSYNSIYRRRTEDRAFCSIFCYRIYIFNGLFSLKMKPKDMDKAIDLPQTYINTVTIGLLTYKAETIQGESSVILSCFSPDIQRSLIMNVVSKKEIKDLALILEEKDINKLDGIADGKL